jgi:hypothetical protein
MVRAGGPSHGGTLRAGAVTQGVADPGPQMSSGAGREEQELKKESISLSHTRVSCSILVTSSCKLEHTGTARTHAHGTRTWHTHMAHAHGTGHMPHARKPVSFAVAKSSSLQAKRHLFPPPPHPHTQPSHTHPFAYPLISMPSISLQVPKRHRKGGGRLANAGPQATGSNKKTHWLAAHLGTSPREGPLGATPLLSPTYSASH